MYFQLDASRVCVLLCCRWIQTIESFIMIPQGKFQPVDQVVKDEDFPACSRLLSCSCSFLHIAEEKGEVCIVAATQVYATHLTKCCFCHLRGGGLKVSPIQPREDHELVKEKGEESDTGPSVFGNLSGK